jgi:serine/threonine protein kinase
MECLRNKFTGGLLLDGGRYQTISPLNHGSFGMVFMAQDLVSNQVVAIKCLTKKSAPCDAGLEFAVDDRSEEYALHNSLGSHPNIVNLLDTFETDAHVYLVMEFCSQGDLYEAIRNGHGPLETEHVRQFMLELVDAVAYIHAKGVYHRDIKPENIFLTQDGAMKLGDFGLATTDKWSYETTVGSDRYMAPEQFDSAGAGYSPAEADIWAIGICLLNILFSRNPFTTPTEADPLFLDFSRDKQSLFDVFPSMSQDTYEVIVQCMNMDPRKRSLEGAREALLRVVSFTTEDESLDDFCGAENPTVASAHREPLRTPSIQTPHIDGGAFPWTKALNETPAHRRQLSAIPDDESYSEDLFSKSGETTDWFSAGIQTPSSSILDPRAIEARLRTFHISRPPQPKAKVSAKVSPAAGSLPIAMGKPFPSMAAVFGRQKETVSKSWSDMWDEDEEEEQHQQEQEQERVNALKELNSRTWSHESTSDNNNNNNSVAKTEPMAAAHVIKGDVDDDLVADGFFFHEASPPAKHVLAITPRYSPPSKRGGNIDKWAALGERRRGTNGSGIMQMEAEKSPGWKQRRQFGFGNNNHIGYNNNKYYEAGVWDHHFSTSHNSNFNNNNGNNNNNGSRGWSKDRLKENSWTKAKDWNWRRDRRPDLGDVEWVGGW